MNSSLSTGFVSNGHLHKKVFDDPITITFITLTMMMSQTILVIFMTFAYNVGYPVPEDTKNTSVSRFRRASLTALLSVTGGVTMPRMQPSEISKISKIRIRKYTRIVLGPNCKKNFE